MSEQRIDVPDDEAWGSCSTPGCPGDARYAAPGRHHVEGCTYPTPTLATTPTHDGAAAQEEEDR